MRERLPLLAGLALLAIAFVIGAVAKDVTAVVNVTFGVG
jgi:hypothetical protein